MERKHHPLSPSNWPAWVACPGYTSDGGRRSSADEGTQQHELFAKALVEARSGALPDEESSPGWAAAEVLKYATPDTIHVEEMATGIADVVSFPDAACGDDMCPSSTVRYFGYPDAWCVKQGRLHVFDYKSGSRPQGYDHWPQLVGYAWAVACSSPGQLDEQATLHVLYGADRWHEEKTVSLADALDDAKYILSRRLFHDDGERSACAQCKWCKHRSTCHAATMAVANIERDVTVADLPPSVVLDRLSIVEGIIKSERERIRDIAIANGGVLDGGGVRYEMRESAGTRKSVDIPALLSEVVVRGIETSPDEIVAACDISKKAFSSLYKDRAKAAGLKVKDLDAIYDAKVERNPPVQKLVRVSGSSVNV